MAVCAVLERTCWGDTAWSMLSPVGLPVLCVIPTTPRFPMTQRVCFVFLTQNTEKYVKVTISITIIIITALMVLDMFPWYSANILWASTEWNSELFKLFWNQSAKKGFIQISSFTFLVRICSWFFLSPPRHCDIYIEVLGWVQFTQILHQTRPYFKSLRIRLFEVLKLTLLSAESGRWPWRPPEGVLTHLRLWVRCTRPFVMALNPFNFLHLNI